jgi:3-deoxy-D-manno-octulosonic-acid transferase
METVSDQESRRPGSRVAAPPGSGGTRGTGATGVDAGFLWPAALAAYDLLTRMAVAGVLVPAELVLRWLGRAAPGDLAERLGRVVVPPRRHGCRRLVVHAVSVGEMRAAAALVRALVAADPAVEVILSAGNRDGRAAARRFAAGCAPVRAVLLLPWDRRAAMRRWLAALRPDAVAVVETEIWPCLFATCRRLGVPLALVSGRLAPRDVPRYRLARPFFRHVLGCAEWIGVQGEADRRRFLRIGAAPESLRVLGDLKRSPEVVVDPGRAVSGGGWEASAAGPVAPPLLVAGSTHAPEERWLLWALAALRRQGGTSRLLLAPRRPGRAAAVCRLARRQGLHSHRTSAGPADGWDVLVLDELGMLAPLYGAGTLAFVGGTLARRGGHTPLEAAAQGLPLLAGPHTAHIAELAGELEGAGALWRLRDRHDLVAAWWVLLSDPERRRRMAAAALGVAAAGEDTAAGYARALLADLAAAEMAARAG